MTKAVPWRSGDRVLLVSPHPDDVAYSIGGLLAIAARTAQPVDVSLLTVFSRSAWALPKELRRRGPAAIEVVRTAEDAAFCDAYSIAHVTLGFPDSSLAGYDEEAERRAEPDTDSRAPAVAAAIGEHLRVVAPDWILCPAAIGDHIDHRIVHDAVTGTGIAAARGRAAADGASILFYEDIPYAAWSSLAEIDARASAAGLRAEVTLAIDGVLAAKVRGMWRYASQTSAVTIEEMMMHAARVAPPGAAYGERLWR